MGESMIETQQTLKDKLNSHTKRLNFAEQKNKDQEDSRFSTSHNHAIKLKSCIEKLEKLMYRIRPFDKNIDTTDPKIVFDHLDYTTKVRNIDDYFLQILILLTRIPNNEDGIGKWKKINKTIESVTSPRARRSKSKTSLPSPKGLRKAFSKNDPMQDTSTTKMKEKEILLHGIHMEKERKKLNRE